MQVPRPFHSLPQHTQSILLAIFVGYIGLVAWDYHGNYVLVAAGKYPAYADFLHKYASSLLLRFQPAENLFDDRMMQEALWEAAHHAYMQPLSHDQLRRVGFWPWMYPPPYIFAIAPLAFMPYVPAYIAWVGTTAIPYLMAMRAILRSPRAWMVALAAPPSYHNLMFAGTGFLSAGFIGFGLAQLQRRPTLAGICIGLASVKPHLGLLVPIALLAGARWQAFSVATITTVGLTAASIWAYGMEPWYATFGSLGYYLEAFQMNGYNLRAMTSVFSAVRLPGGSFELAWAAQNASMLAMAILVAGVWWHGRHRADTLGLQSAILCAGATLAPHMVYFYDLAMLVPAAAWIWCDLRARGGARWEYALLFVPLAALLPAHPIAQTLGVQLGAVCAGLILLLALRRYVCASRSGVCTRRRPDDQSEGSYV